MGEKRKQTSSKTEVHNEPAIEVKSNKVTLTVLNDTIRKKEAVGAELIAIVSTQGFTKPAREEAKKRNISVAVIPEAVIIEHRKDREKDKK